MDQATASDLLLGMAVADVSPAPLEPLPECP